MLFTNKKVLTTIVSSSVLALSMFAAAESFANGGSYQDYALKHMNTSYNHQGWYAGILGGPTITSDISGPHDTKLKFDNPGFNVGGDVGYQTGPWRLEGEFDYMRSDLKSINFDGFKIPVSNTDLNVYTVMANGYYDFHNMFNDRIQPYLGVGLGWAHLDSNTGPGSEDEGAVQGIVGTKVHLTQKVDATVDYRYYTTMTDLKGTNSRFQNHMFNVGLIYYFHA